ncbi:MAG: signal recognition particle protein [Gammaproteobacteria bacterium]
MFNTLTERLSGTVQKLTGRGRISEDNIRQTVRQIRMALLEADVALPVAKAFVARVRERALGEEVARSLNPGQAFTKIVHDELVRVLGGTQAEIAGKGSPAVVMLVGLQGAGKTTSAAKIALSLRRRFGRDILLVSTDVYRPAAREQLATLGRENDLAVFTPDSDDPARIVELALDESRRRGSRWLIVDTAGRLHVDDDMMAEARKLQGIANPAETLFVVDSMAGQDALNSAAAFHEALPLTGIVLTKADGDARGGVALSVREVTGVPIKLVGTGEKPDAWERFAPERFASRILGMGDVVGLVEQVHEKLDKAEMERVAGKVKRGRALSLEDFRAQLEQMLNMGGIAGLLEKMPGLPAGAAGNAAFDEKQLRRQIAVIDSMTVRERRRPEVIDGSRKRRIAAGCGQQVQDVNRLLKQHKQLVRTMKRVSRGGGMQQMLGALTRGRRPPG